MKTINELVDEGIMNRLAQELGFRPDPKAAEVCVAFARHEIAAQLCALLSTADIKYAAKQYRYPA